MESAELNAQRSNEKFTSDLLFVKESLNKGLNFKTTDG